MLDCRNVPPPDVDFVMWHPKAKLLLNEGALLVGAVQVEVDLVCVSVRKKISARKKIPPMLTTGRVTYVGRLS